MKTRLLAACVLAGLLVAATAHAAVITPLNRDPAGSGLNDPTAAAPVGGNPGTTIGEQRRIAYQFAADLWGAVLQSNVEIRVAASFQPLACTATAGVLGSAGPWYVFREFDNAPLAGTWYHSALADAFAGEDLAAGEPAPNDIDITSRFNANLGTPGCLQASGWYYGLDGNTPAGKINFLDVVMHEIGHGLGFSGFLNKTTGALANFDGTPRTDVYTHNAYDNVENKTFDDPAMTDALRATAMKTPGRTVWVGGEVAAQMPIALDPLLRLDATGALTASYTAFGTASFGPKVTAANFDGEVVVVNDGVGDTADACEPLAAGTLTGKIAFINRGTCSFEPKTINAAGAGAIGVIIGNVASSGTPGTAPGMAAATNTATIPAISLNLSDADAFRGASPGINVNMTEIPGRYAGADTSGRVQLYAPTVVATGSTFSHFDTSHTPNAVMEPAINSDLDSNLRLDLTPALYEDQGWVLNAGNARIGNCTTNVDVVQEGGLIVGANVQAWSSMCLSSTPDKAAYQNCMSAYKDGAIASGVLTGNQGGKVVACAAKINK
jgi:hypothetical protein